MARRKKENQTTFSFEEQLAVGDAGEQLMIRLHPEWTRLDGRKGDFKDAKGRVVEVKTDSHDSPNFFFELYSNYKTEKPGGVYQAYDNDAVTYVYYFLPSNTEYTFLVDDLVEWLDENSSKYWKHYIKNKGYYTLGIVVPIKKVEHIFHKVVYDVTGQRIEVPILQPSNGVKRTRRSKGDSKRPKAKTPVSRIRVQKEVHDS